jgi:putative tryptophan/tyrosine transport system substrate-binding protein
LQRGDSLATRRSRTAAGDAGVGYLSSFSPNPRFAAAFIQGLKELGFVVDQNVAIEYRYAEGHYDQLPALVADLVRLKVAVIYAVGGSAPGKAAKAATSTIPIVFGSGGGDPVKDGLVASLNRPGGNVTGVNIITTALGSKRFELLHQLVPKGEVVGVLMNPNYPDAELQIRELQEAAVSLKQTITIASAGSEGELDATIATLVQHGANALFVTNDPSFTSLRKQIVALAVRYALPAAYYAREFPDAGGLMSYGADFADAFRQEGNYVGRILKGEQPADLPVMQSTKFEFVLNLKTAKTLGLTIPPTLLALVDEVIE